MAEDVNGNNDTGVDINTNTNTDPGKCTELDFTNTPIVVEDFLDWNQNSFNLFDNPISKHVWTLKYQHDDEASIYPTINRVAKAIFPKDNSLYQKTYDLISTGIVIPAGRILAGAGIPEHKSTLMNCYVMGELPDSLDGIMECLHESAKTQKYGGGIGIDFTPLRPKGAEISTAAYFAGGPIAFMDLWDAMGQALQAGGNRRGGKMGTMRCHHPDILEFVEAKSKHGKLSSFNLSVLITDDFMQAVNDDNLWDLYHEKPRQGEADTQTRITIEAADGEPHNVVEAYLWDRIPARKLWDAITRQTYYHAEPGVIFIDRMNEMNPLSYCEEILTTNPCGEQPLPPYGACNLGSINLARLVDNPFDINASINWALLEQAVWHSVTLLDAILGTTEYPLQEMQVEALCKRRIGLGITGLADFFAQLLVPYNSESAVRLCDTVMEFVANNAYQASAMLAKKYGSFPSKSEAAHQRGKFFKRLSQETQEMVRKYGLRNGVILSIAPTGTISTVFGDVSSGCEPHFAHRTKRMIREKDQDNNDTLVEHTSYSYTVRMYAVVHATSLDRAYNYIIEHPELYPTTQHLTPQHHIRIQAALQRWVDSSISKTINVPEDTPFEEFRGIYQEAFDAGCKGCTTYRPNDTTGAVLISDEGDTSPTDGGNKEGEDDVAHIPSQEKAAPSITQSGTKTFKRPELLAGVTYKVSWPGLSSSVFVTINHDDEYNPVEVFISSKNSQYAEWSIAMSVMISKLLQYGVPASEVGQNLKEINLSQIPSFQNGKLYGSIISRIGEIIEEHQSSIIDLDSIPGKDLQASYEINVLGRPLRIDWDALGMSESGLSWPLRCSSCGSFNTHVEEGCLKCDDCGQSNCG